MPLSIAHGDFVPWNMDLRSESLLLWDWEKALKQAPWSYDAIHFEFLTRRCLRVEDRKIALRGTLEALAEHAPALGVPGLEDDVSLHLAAYAACRSANEYRIGRPSADAAWLVGAARTLLD